MKTYKITFMRMDCGTVKAGSEKEAITKYMSSRGWFKRDGIQAVELKN